MKRTFNKKADIAAFAIQERDGAYRAASEDDIIQAAMAVMDARFTKGTAMISPDKTREFLKLQLAHVKHEIFAVMWLDNQHRVIAFEELFRGTIDGASVYPREVVKAALHYNAAACILCHNHPSGIAEPSQADKHITDKVKNALNLIDVRTLDHVIVAESTYSFAECGLI